MTGLPGAPTVSVVIPNRDRVRSLARTLLALKQQSLRGFEVIIVSNQPARIASDIRVSGEATVLRLEGANISMARNVGLGVAHGEIIAFCDDDAVPEPTWLERLVAPFADETVGAVGGLVRGRNGVSVQWGFQEVDCFGNDWPVEDGSRAPGRVLKTVGTNCAFRRQALASIGGFDEAFRFFLDETDANWRLAQAGWKIVAVQSAEVHHAYGRSAMRTSERVPLSLVEIAASKVHFCNRHGDPSQLSDELDRFRQDQRRRLLRMAGLGLLSPTRVSPLLASLEEGLVSGANRTAILPGIPSPKGHLRPFAHGPAPESLRLVCGPFSRRKLLRQVKEMCEPGHTVVTLIDMELTARPLTVRFTDGGFWYHRGGVYGQTHRNEAFFRLKRRRDAIARETQRISDQRRIGT